MKLDVYSPLRHKGPRDVIVFMHGGSWRSGKRGLYRFFGKGMARKGAVGVVVDYRLSPDAKYDGMAMDVAEATKWVKQHIAEFDGNPDKIFLSGHSAGAQLAALVACDNRFFDSLTLKNPVKGTILIDPFGLDMYKFLTKSNYINPVYYDVFTRNSDTWKKGSPMNYLHKGMPPFLIFVGNKTNEAIKINADDLYREAIRLQPDLQLIHVKRKRHVGMIFSYINPFKKSYKEILTFMHEH